MTTFTQDQRVTGLTDLGRQRAGFFYRVSNNPKFAILSKSPGRLDRGFYVYTKTLRLLKPPVPRLVR